MARQWQPQWEDIVERMNALRGDNKKFRVAKAWYPLSPDSLNEVLEFIETNGLTDVRLSISLTADRPENEVELHRRTMESFKNEQERNQ